MNSNKDNNPGGGGGNHSPPPPYSMAGETKAPPPQAPGYPPVPQFNATILPTIYPPAPPTVITTTTIGPAVISARTATFGPFPVEMDCPYCQNHIVTHTSKVPGILPWIMFVVCFVLGFILVIPWCLCCLPFCIDSCLDVIHSCPSCKRLVGKFSRL